MRDAKEELTRSWLIKAKRDLLSAKELARATEPLLDTAAYHCQQAAEKAVKAFLLYKNIRFDKTHDINVLILQAMDVEPTFSSHIETARILTPLAVEFRYPGDYLEPEPEEFREAFDTAGCLFDFVTSILPASTHP
jgi:HEPN domain-containing protein